MPRVKDSLDYVIWRTDVRLARLNVQRAKRPRRPKLSLFNEFRERYVPSNFNKKG